MVYEFDANHFRKFYWRQKEVLLPIYQDFHEVRAAATRAAAVRLRLTGAVGWSWRVRARRR